MDVKKDILWRVYLVFLCMILLGTGILARAFYIQQVEGEKWESLASKQHLKYVDINAERGSIYSENGNMLSTSIPVFDVYVDFMADGLREKDGKRWHENLDSLSYRLAALFRDKSKASYKAQLTAGYKKKKRYYALKKKISFEEYTALREFPLVRQGRNRSGFIIEVRDNRVNPYVLLANRTIGLSRGDTSKNVGLERSYDSVLRGQNGQRLVRYVAGTYIPVSGAEIDPENGKDIVTTIDTYIQDVAQNALLRMMDSNYALHGTCIVMEVKTGKIKAIANLGRRPNGEYLEDYNYGLGRSTEPGSVFKLATLIALLEDKHVDTGTIVDCEGGIMRFYGLRIRDSHLGTQKVTVKDAFSMSSNVAFAKLADEFYHDEPQRWYEHLKRMGLTTRTGVDITGTARPFVKSPDSKYWTKTTIPFMAHGYEELVTPLHMLMIYNAVANDGKMMRPYLVNSIQSYGVNVQEFEPEVIAKIASEETIAKAKECLREVVEGKHGTARALRSPFYEFGGKTGTAVTAMDNRGYNKGNKIYQSAFMGFFPYDDPQYSIAVVIQNGQESRLAYGGVVAGPVFKEVADKLYALRISREKVTNYVQVPDTGMYRIKGLSNDLGEILSAFGIPYESKAAPLKGFSSTLIRNRHASEVATIAAGKTVPDVTGMGLKDAVYLLESCGLKVRINGRGKVTEQSIAKHTPVKKGEIINIQLN